MFNSQPPITLKAENNKAFNRSCLFATFKITSGSIADCLEHCLEDCRCQSFQICQNTKCQLCSSHKEENSSLLHEKDGCIYATYEIRHLTKKFQVMLLFSGNVNGYFLLGFFFMYHTTFPNILSLIFTVKPCSIIHCKNKLVKTTKKLVLLNSF